MIATNEFQTQITDELLDSLEKEVADELIDLIKIVPVEALKTIVFHGKDFFELKQIINNNEKNVPKKNNISSLPFKTEIIGSWKVERVNLSNEDDFKRNLKAIADYCEKEDNIKGADELRMYLDAVVKLDNRTTRKYFKEKFN